MGELITGAHTYGTVARRGTMNNVAIGRYCSLATGIIVDSGFNHNIEFASTYPFNTFTGKGSPNVTCKGDIIIGNDVWIGEDVMIMSGITIGDGAVIGSRSIVTKDIEAYSMSVGSPCRIKKYRFNSEVIEALLRIKWWDWDDQKVLDNAHLLGSNDLKEFIEKHG